jgi:hypothetical protein
MWKKIRKGRTFSFLRSFDCLGNIIQPGTMLPKKKKHFHAVLFHLQEKNLFRTTTTTKLTTNCVRTRRRLAVCAKGSYVHHNEGVIQMNQLFQGYINNVGYTRKRNWDIMEASLKPSCVFHPPRVCTTLDGCHSLSHK